MTVLLALWSWAEARLATARRSEDGWGAVEWMVIMVFVVGLAYTANEMSDRYLTQKIDELFSQS